MNDWYLRLDRHYQPDYTEGELYLVKSASTRFLCFTIERPWADNEPNVSCIPDGHYQFNEHTRPDGRRAYIITDGCCVATPDELDPDRGLTRWGILMHPANRPDELEGCIAPGLGQGEGLVQHSRAAMMTIAHAIGPRMSTWGWIPLQINPSPPASPDRILQR